MVGNVAKNAVNGSTKTKTGLPVAAVDILEKFVGDSQAGKQFLQVLRDGVTDEMMKGSGMPNLDNTGTNSKSDMNSEADYLPSEAETSDF